MKLNNLIIFGLYSYMKKADFSIIILILSVFVQPVKSQININRVNFKHAAFIENIGQDADIAVHHKSFGKILFSYDGFTMPILFTTSGIVYIQRKIIPAKRSTNTQKVDKEKSAVNCLDKYLNVTWINSNPNPIVTAERALDFYHSYGLLTQKAYAYSKITYTEVYPGIDIIFSLDQNGKRGFEYSIIAKPGADLSKVQIKYDGDIKSIRKDEKGNLVLNTAIGGIVETAPKCFYGKEKPHGTNSTVQVPVETMIKSGVISFVFPQGYDRSQSLVIDPFVSPVGGFTGLNSDKGYDIDYDYDGNIYVRGGGDYMACELAKYSKAGVLQWVFHGNIATPSWSFGRFNGGWVVEKGTGNVYIGQGGTYPVGFKIIRLNAAGLYDNFITIPDPLFLENWKMLWTCNNGNPQIFIAGGGITSDINFSVFSPPSVSLSGRNISGLPNVTAQDVSDAVIDPETNAMYSIFSSAEPTATFVNNRVFKHTSPYNSLTISWSTPSGYTTLLEGICRPYLNTNDANSANCLAVNPSYLFYWDGKNLKAFNKASGLTVGTPLSILSNTALMQGGIAADACNNVYVGEVNGIIKVYNFNGTTFDDAAAPDIVISGQPAASTYALTYDNGKKMIYACGQGYVAAFDVSAYCAAQIYSVSVNTDCINASVSGQLTPAPPSGSAVTYNLYNGITLVGSNSSGIFNALVPNTNYTIRAVINFACSGIQFEKDFSLVAPVISTVIAPATCTQNIGSITVTATGGVAPYTFSLVGTNFQTGNTFTGLSAATYTVFIKDANGCSNRQSVIVPVSGVNTVTILAGTNQTICEGTGASLNVISNANNFSWLPAAGLNNPNIFNPVASPLTTTKYYVTATSGPCSKTDSLIVFVNPAPIANAGSSITICYGKNTQLSGSGGILYTWTPTTYLDNANLSNPNVINPLNSSAYTLRVQDNKGCNSLNLSTVLVTVKPPEKLFAGNDTSIAINQPLQLNAVDVNSTSFINYAWSPVYGLSNPAINNPVAILDRDIKYTITATTAQNCIGTTTINIKVFKGPEIYVPNAFSPNGDSRNDLLKAIPVGLREFKYFAIFNRYGERIFYTTNPANGWDGKVITKSQNTGSYVWIAEGIDYWGNLLIRRGNVLLIR